LWVHAIDDRGHGGLAKPAVWFAFTTDRRAEHPKSMLKDFRGLSGVNACETDLAG